MTTEADQKYAQLLLDQPFLLAKHLIKTGFENLDEKIHGRIFHFLMGREIPKKLLHPKTYYRHKPGNLKRMYSGSRFSYKTTIGMAITLAKIIKHRNKASIVSMATCDMATQTVTAIRDMLTLPQVVDLYGDFRNAEKWARATFAVLGAPTGKRDFTLDSAGVDKGVSSAHCDGILWFDDLVNEKSYQSAAERQNAVHHMQALVPVASHDCTWMHTCTPWPDYDPFQYCMSLPDDWDVLVVPGRYDAFEDRVTGKIFPVEYPFECIPKLKRDLFEGYEAEMGPSLFASQFLCDPHGAKDNIFKTEWFDGVTPNEVPKRLNIGVCVDPADPQEMVKRKTGKSLVGVAVVGIDEDGGAWILRAEHGDWPDFRDFMKVIFTAHDDFIGRRGELNLNPSVEDESFDPLQRNMCGVWFEQGLLRGRVRDMLDIIIKASGHGQMQIWPYSADTHASKISRMHNLAAMFRMGRVKCVRGRIAALGEEARSINFDKDPIMDAMDAAEHLIQVVPRPTKVVTADKDQFEWTMKAMKDRMWDRALRPEPIGVGGSRRFLGEMM